MSFRLVNKDTRRQATEELLQILAVNGPTRTSDLSGTRKFHGMRTLSNRQICRLLRESGKAEMEYGGQWKFTYGIWRLKAQQ
jgi:hypothetical protein